MANLQDRKKQISYKFCILGLQAPRQKDNDIRYMGECGMRVNCNLSLIKCAFFSKMQMNIYIICKLYLNINQIPPPSKENIF